MSVHPHDTVPFLMHRVVARVAEAGNSEFRRLGLNVFSARVVTVLLLNRAATVGELAEATSMDQSTLSHILGRLTRDALVVKKRQRHDNRSVLVKLTPKGRRVAEKCLESVVEHEKLVTRGMSGEQIHLLKAMLYQVYANVQALGVKDDTAE